MTARGATQRTSTPGRCEAVVDAERQADYLEAAFEQHAAEDLVRRAAERVRRRRDDPDPDPTAAAAADERSSAAADDRWNVYAMLSKNGRAAPSPDVEIHSTST